MKLNNHGLTVGELTVGVAIFIILSFIWTSISQKQESTETSFLKNTAQNSFTQSRSFDLKASKLFI